MIIINIKNNYLSFDKNSFKIIPDDKLLQLDDEYIFSNFIFDCQAKNFIYLPVFYWLVNNQDQYNFYYIDLDKAKEDIKNIKEFILLNKKYLNQAIEFTKYHISINKLFNYKFNKSIYHSYRQHNIFIQNKIEKYKIDLPNKYSWIDLFNIPSYDFTSRTGRIMARKSNFEKLLNNPDFDFNIFKTDDFEYYRLDFKSFYVRFLSIYTGESFYSADDFYEKYSIYFNLTRDDFKKAFNAYINGSGLKEYPDEFMNEFNKLFRSVIELNNNIYGNSIINNFGRKVIPSANHLSLSYLISSTAEDTLKIMYNKLHNIYKNDTNIRFIYNYCDELFVAVKNVKKLDELKENIKVFEFMNVGVKKV